MKISKKGLDLIKSFEGLRLKPYLCSARVPTIGYGSTYYEDGARVQLTDKEITEERAEQLFLNTLKTYEQGVDSMTRDDVTQSQFDALVSFAYNLGLQALKKSTLLLKVNKDPKDKTIGDEFRKWINAGGRKVNGLVIRRDKEAQLYYS